MHHSVSCKKTTLLILLISLLPGMEKAFAQKQPALYANHITTQQGLSSNIVDQILQDEEGFIWILTFNGISQYDGYSFKYFG
jgi:ligand-binding sensor domain-containing protein